MLLTCVAYAGGTRVGEVPIERAAEFRQAPDAFVWVALRDPDPEELERVQALFNLHPLAVEDVRHGQQRPKVEEYGDALFVLMQLLEPVEGGYQQGEMAVFVGPGYVVSVRCRARKGFEEVRARSEREPELLKLGPGYVLYALMDATVDRYFPVLDALEDELEIIERDIFAPGHAPRASIEALYTLKQRLTVAKHAVAPLLEGISNLTGARTPVLCAGLRDYFRDVYDHLLRLNQTADTIRDALATAISVNLAFVNLAENETMKRLAAYAALLAVPTMIAGIYGMNFEHMPELKWRFGYAAVMGVMVAIDALLFVRLRRAKWL